MDQINNPRTASEFVAARNAGWLERHREAGAGQKMKAVAEIAKEIGKDPRFVLRGIASAKASEKARQQKTADSR